MGYFERKIRWGDYSPESIHQICSFWNEFGVYLDNNSINLQAYTI